MEIKFKSVKLNRVLTIGILMVIIGAFILFFLLIFLPKQPNELGLYFSEKFHPKTYLEHHREHYFILILGIIIAAPMCLIIVSLIRLLKDEYTLKLLEKDMEIKSGKSVVKLSYSEIKNIIICNNTDYAKIIIAANNKKYKYNIGIANLKFINYFEIFRRKIQFKIFESFTDIDKILSKNFHKEMREYKGKNIIEYKNKKQ